MGKYEKDVISVWSDFRKTPGSDCPDYKMGLLRAAAVKYSAGTNSSSDEVLPRLIGIVLKASETQLVFTKQELQYVIDFGFLTAEDTAIVSLLQQAVGAVQHEITEIEKQRRVGLRGGRRRLFTRI